MAIIYLLVSIVLLASFYLVNHQSPPKLPSTLPRVQRPKSYLPFRVQWSYLTDCRQLFIEAYEKV